jgi:hypothetical protein
MSGYYYLATVYTKHPQGQHVAWLQSCRWAAQFIKAGVPVFSPIAHSHYIALYGEIEPLNHDIWLSADRPLMDGAKGLIVVMSEGWEESYGIGEEIKTFTEAGKPVAYWEPDSAIPQECLS